MSSGWTVDTLREYMNARFDAVRESVATANAVAEQRATKIETETKSKFENTNEWRSTVTDAQSKFLPRTEFEQVKKSLEDKIAAKSIQVVLSLGVGFIAVIVAIFNFATAQAS
jgi:hypothetical protein